MLYYITVYYLLLHYTLLNYSRLYGYYISISVSVSISTCTSMSTSVNLYLHLFLYLHLCLHPGTAPHARGILNESAQPKGDQLSVFFCLSPAAGACVRVWFGHPAPQALSPSQCPQLSTHVRDYRGKSFCSCEVGCLAKCPNPTQASQLGGAGPWRFGWHFSLLGLRGSERRTLAGSPR